MQHTTTTANTSPCKWLGSLALTLWIRSICVVRPVLSARWNWRRCDPSGGVKETVTFSPGCPFPTFKSLWKPVGPAINLGFVEGHDLISPCTTPNTSFAVRGVLKLPSQGIDLSATELTQAAWRASVANIEPAKVMESGLSRRLIAPR